MQALDEDVMLKIEDGAEVTCKSEEKEAEDDHGEGEG